MKQMLGLINENKANELGLGYKPTEFEGIVKYIWFRGDADEDPNWKEAEKNTFTETTIMSMEDVLGSPTPFPTPVYIVSTRSFKLGAAAILNKEFIRRKLGKGKYILLPSSVHEVLLVKDEGLDISGYTQMVRDVNESTVNPADQLIDKAYYFTV